VRGPDEGLDVHETTDWAELPAKVFGRLFGELFDRSDPNATQLRFQGRAKSRDRVDIQSVCAVDRHVHWWMRARVGASTRPSMASEAVIPGRGGGGRDRGQRKANRERGLRRSGCCIRRRASILGWWRGSGAFRRARCLGLALVSALPPRVAEPPEFGQGTLAFTRGVASGPFGVSGSLFQGLGGVLDLLGERLGGRESAGCASRKR
jgi:hypothetical protein